VIRNYNNNNTQIYITSAIIQIKVKTPKLRAEALGKESSSGSVKSCCEKNQAAPVSKAAVKRIKQ